MTRQDFGKIWRKGALLSVLLVLIAGGLIWAVWGDEQAASVPLTLPDGSTVLLAGVTFGTNHVFGGTLARLTARTPPVMQEILVRLFGSRAVARQTISTAQPCVVAWLYSTGAAAAPATGPTGFFDAYLADESGFVSGSGQNFSPASGTFAPLQFNAFPRRDRTLALHLYYHDFQGQVKDCGNIKFTNPQYHAYPQWQAEALPASRRVGDVQATLTAISTGHDSSMNYTEHGVEFGTNRTDGQNLTACYFSLRSLTNTNQIWRVEHVELSDATGNLVVNMGMSWGGSDEGTFGFSPGLWPGEAAWKLRCEIKRTKGFAPGEIFTFIDVPLGAPMEKFQLGWTTNINGITVTLEQMIRRPPQTNSWSSSQLSEAQFRVMGLTNDFHLDLIETRADDGTKVENPSWSSSGDTQKRGLRNVPEGAKTLDFTFAVHQGRWLEFIVKPEMGPARVEHK